MWELGSRSQGRRVAEIVTPLLFLLPAGLLMLWLLAYPLGEVVHLSLSDWNGLGAPRWIGLGNFEALVDDPRFKESVVHNLLILLAMPIWIVIPYGVAWGLFSQIWGWRFFRFAYFVPVVLAPAVVGVAFGLILHQSGPLNEVLRAVGLDGVARAWLNEPGLALPIVIAVAIWSTFGMGTMIFLAALSNLDQEQIDAARVDGASPAQIQRHVVFWQMLPVIEFWAILILVISFTAFLPLIFALTHGGPGTSTYTIDFDLYGEAFRAGALGYAAAIGVAMLLIIGLLSAVIVGAFRWRRR
jgi:ABC-type sugar transport system permease subunit